MGNKYGENREVVLHRACQRHAASRCMLSAGLQLLDWAVAVQALELRGCCRLMPSHVQACKPQSLHATECKLACTALLAAAARERESLEPGLIMEIVGTVPPKLLLAFVSRQARTPACKSLQPWQPTFRQQGACQPAIWVVFRQVGCECSEAGSSWGRKPWPGALFHVALHQPCDGHHQIIEARTSTRQGLHSWVLLCLSPQGNQILLQRQAAAGGSVTLIPKTWSSMAARACQVLESQRCGTGTTCPPRWHGCKTGLTLGALGAKSVAAGPSAVPGSRKGLLPAGKPQIVGIPPLQCRS